MSWDDEDDLGFLLDSPSAEGGPPFVRGSNTSEQAAQSIKPHVSILKAKVLQYIVDQHPNGATDDEIEVALGLRHQTASARRRDLVLVGAITDSGTQRVTRSGCKAVVWTSVPQSQWVTRRLEIQSQGRVPKKVDDPKKELRQAIKPLTDAECQEVLAFIGMRVAKVTPEEVAAVLDYLDD